MTCPRCGDENTQGAKFCKVCGEILSDSGYSYGSPSYGIPPSQQQGYPQPGYMQYPNPNRGNPKRNALAIIGFILSLVAMPGCVCAGFIVLVEVPVVVAMMVIMMLLGGTGIFLCAMGFRSEKRGLAIAGLVLGIVSVMLIGYMLTSLLVMQQAGTLESLIESVSMIIPRF